MPEFTPDELPTFVALTAFERAWGDLRLGEDDRIALELDIVAAIAAGDDRHPPIPGTGGCRKARFAPEGRGKSGAFRVIYHYVEIGGVVYLLLLYGKGDKANLTQSEKNTLAKVVAAIRARQSGESRP